MPMATPDERKVWADQRQVGAQPVERGDGGTKTPPLEARDATWTNRVEGARSSATANARAITFPGSRSGHGRKQMGMCRARRSERWCPAAAAAGCFVRASAADVALHHLPKPLRFTSDFLQLPAQRTNFSLRLQQIVRRHPLLGLHGFGAGALLKPLSPAKQLVRWNAVLTGNRGCGDSRQQALLDDEALFAFRPMSARRRCGYRGIARQCPRLPVSTGGRARGSIQFSHIETLAGDQRHLEVRLGCRTIWANPVFRNIFPSRSWRNPVSWHALGLVIDETTDHALPTPAWRTLLCERRRHLAASS